MQDTITAEAALSDEILQAAREVVENHVAQFEVYLSNPWAGCGIKNRPLLTLLDHFIGAAEPVANAIRDNCQDDNSTLTVSAAKGLSEALYALGDVITACAASPESERAPVALPTGFSLPSCTGKELV